MLVAHLWMAGLLYIYRHSPVIKRGNENFLINRGMNGNILYGWGIFQQDMLEITGLDMKSHGKRIFLGLELGMTYEDSSYSEAWRLFTIVLVFFYRQKQLIVFEDLLSRRLAYRHLKTLLNHLFLWFGHGHILLLRVVSPSGKARSNPAPMCKNRAYHFLEGW